MLQLRYEYCDNRAVIFHRVFATAHSSLEMALLGFHIVLTLVAASILQKLTARFSFGRKLLARKLYRYLPPSVEELKAVSGRAVNNTQLKGSRRRRNEDNHESNAGFPVPKDANINLLKVPVRSTDILQLPLYVDFRWLLDFGLCTFLVYAVSEMYIYVLGSEVTSSEVNLSIVWLLVVLALCLRALATLTSAVFSTSEGNDGERSLVLCFGAVYFLACMCVVLAADRLFDCQFERAYSNFTGTAEEFLKSQDLSLLSSERSPIVLYVFLSVLFGCLSGMLVLPSFRYAKMYAGALPYAEESPLTRILLHADFLAPLLAILLWTHPVSAYLLENEQRRLTIEQLYSLRLWCVLIACLLRFVNYVPHLQSHLNLAFEKLDALKRESGRINSWELQRMIYRYYSYLCAAAIQYFVPCILQLSLVFLLKTLGHYSWLTPFGFPECSLSSSWFSPAVVNSSTTATTRSLFARGDIQQSLTSVYALLNVTVNRGVWSLVLVLTLAINFSLSLIGVLYNAKFGRA